MTDSRRVQLGVVRGVPAGVSIRPTSDLDAPDHVAYSRFKYGCGDTAVRFGTRLADRYWRAVERDRRGAPHFVSCSGYASAPPAAHALVQPFITRLSGLAGADGLVLDATVFKVHRGRLAGDDYAQLSIAGRSAAIATSDLHLPSGLELPAGAQVVAIDDVRVTGLHARRIDALYQHHDVTVWHACLLETVDAGEPTLEAVLNAGAVHGIDQLIALANETSYVPNARACRFLLSDAGRVGPFVGAVPGTVSHTLLRYATNDGLGNFPRYAAGYEALLRVMAEREPAPADTRTDEPV